MDMHQDRIETVLRVVGILEFKDQMRIILRAVQSGRRKDIDKAVEILETGLHSDFRLALIPLLDDIPAKDRLGASCTALGIDLLEFSSFEQICQWLAKEGDQAVVQLLAIASLADKHASPQEPDLVKKTKCLRTIPLFQGLKTRALMAIAGSCHPRTFRSGDIVFQEGQGADSVYLFFKGRLGVLSPMLSMLPLGAEPLFSTSLAGERPWIDKGEQLYTLRAETDTVLLEMTGADFCQALQEYPLIVMALCRLYSRQLRTYHLAMSPLLGE